MFDFATLLRTGVRYALARRVVLFLPVLLVAILVADISAHARMPLGELVGSRLAIYLPLGIVAGYAVWYRERWLTAIDRRFFRQRYDAEQILRGIVSDLRRGGALEVVAPSFVARLQTALHPTFAALMQCPAGGHTFHTIASAPAGAAPGPLPATSRIIALTRALEAPLQLGASEDEPLVRGLPPAERKLVADARLDLLALVPAHEGPRDLLIALGPKRSEEPYSGADLDFITAIADTLSLAAGREPQPPPEVSSLEECPTCGACYDSGTLQCPHDQGPLESGGMTRVLAARYRLDRRIGEGGMSRLYRAMDLALQRDVAVKVLREQWLATPDSEARFRREARLAAGLSHPNVITIFDFGVSGKTAFLVMELLQGRTLRDELRARRTMPLPEVLGIVRTVGLAIEAAHASGLVHRDLKPENVFLASTGTREIVKVLDFGLAKSLGANDGFSTGPVIIGTPHYMAPEQLRGEDPQPSWDTWALAAMAFELLSGSPPFLAPAALQLTPSPGTPGDGPIVPWLSPTLSGELAILNSFFGRALAIDAAGRHGSVAALVDAFESAAAGVWMG
jgi:tRNA A-37 threonylcarbamoyl transferase component Bud32